MGEHKYVFTLFARRWKGTSSFPRGWRSSKTRLSTPMIGKRTQALLFADESPFRSRAPLLGFVGERILIQWGAEGWLFRNPPDPPRPQIPKTITMARSGGIAPFLLQVQTYPRQLAPLAGALLVQVARQTTSGAGAQPAVRHLGQSCEFGRKMAPGLVRGFFLVFKPIQVTRVQCGPPGPWLKSNSWNCQQFQFFH